jgi:hypothetical protein
LGIVHALNVDRERIAIAEHHRPRASGDLVLKRSPSDGVVLGIDPVSACEVHVRRSEVDLGAAIPSELADG